MICFFFHGLDRPFWFSGCRPFWFSDYQPFWLAFILVYQPLIRRRKKRKKRKPESLQVLPVLPFSIMQSLDFHNFINFPSSNRVALRGNDCVGTFKGFESSATKLKMTVAVKEKKRCFFFFFAFALQLIWLARFFFAESLIRALVL